MVEISFKPIPDNNHIRHQWTLTISGVTIHGEQKTVTGVFKNAHLSECLLVVVGTAMQELYVPSIEQLIEIASKENYLKHIVHQVLSENENVKRFMAECKAYNEYMLNNVLYYPDE